MSPQAIGMMKDCKSLPAVAALLDKAKSVLGYDLLQARALGGGRLLGGPGGCPQLGQGPSLWLVAGRTVWVLALLLNIFP